jgi:hypothetical protein
MQALLDYYRIPDDFYRAIPAVAEASSGARGFFRFGAQNICFGQNRSGAAPDVPGSAQFDASKDVRIEGKQVHLPFDFDEVVGNLRLERYRENMASDTKSVAASEPVRKIYYFIRNFLPVPVRRHLQREYFRGWRDLPFPAWPVDFTVDNLHEDILRLTLEASGQTSVPFIWFWPDGAPNCFMMTHDVETAAGRDFTRELIDLDDSYGIKASYQVIPEERYAVPDEYVRQVRSRGCEFNVHDLTHDGQLYQRRDVFLQRAKKINEYTKKFGSRGFRAGGMYRNVHWFDAYDFSYEMSVPNVAHLEPQRGGCCTVMPFFVGRIVELPLTTIQDYSLFNILNDRTIDLWKEQLNLIRQRNGLMSFITHPDYLISKRNRQVYEGLLAHLRSMIAREKIWATLPGDVDIWWRQRAKMNLVREGEGWRIEGEGAERARVAHAVIEGNRLTYKLSGAPTAIRVSGLK